MFRCRRYHSSLAAAGSSSFADYNIRPFYLPSVLHILTAAFISAAVGSTIISVVHEKKNYENYKPKYCAALVLTAIVSAE